MTKYQINIENNNRKEIVIENHNSIKKDIDNHSDENHETFFYDEYHKADLILKKIINFDKKNNESCDKEYDCKNYKKNNKDNHSDTKNNIIIFSGDRGSGKTSAMVSFGKYLENDVKKENENEKRTCRYKLLEMIDPSYFRKNESILLNIITVMFKMAKSFIEEGKSNEEHDNKTSEFNDLLRDFEKVFKSVNKMDSVIPEENSLEYLNELSSSINLKESIYKLIKKFLKLFNEKHEYLVIMIDDLDMNISHASNMLEQIRKFLIHKNIIILLATNIDQLQFEIKESYSKYYEKILHPMQNQPSVSVDVDDMATKYLLKLFPPLQRVHIGNAANKLINTNLKIENDKDKTIDNDLQRVILNLIWRKTRLLFINEDDQLHPIIPTNLRALHQLIYMLIEMDDVKVLDEKENNEKKIGLFSDETEYKKAQDNFNKFKDYILNIWIPSNVSFDEKKVFDNIPKDIKRINKHFIQSINVIGSKYKKTILIKDIDFEKYLEEKGKNDILDRDIYTFVSPNDPKFPVANKISDIYNYPSNNTVGDILLLTDKYKTYFEATNQTKFIEAVKIYYSLLLFETMFFSNTNNENTKENIESDYKDIKSCIDKISPIQRLIGGTFFFPHYFNILKSLKYNSLKKEEKEVIRRIEEDSKFFKTIYNIINNTNDLLLDNEINALLETSNIEIPQKDIDVIFNDQDFISIRKKLFTKFQRYEDKLKKDRIDLRLKQILENIIIDIDEKYENYFKQLLSESEKKPLLSIINSRKKLLDKKDEKIDQIFDDILNEENNISKNLLILNKNPENHLYYNLFNKLGSNNNYLLFFILYYGGSRPERSESEHIYNTKNLDVESITRNKYRFDILSLLVNSLNPRQTLARYDEKDKKYRNNIKAWEVYNSFDNLTIQNFILPIYSVDLLLEYLRKTYDISDLNITVDNENNPEDYHIKMRAKDNILKYYNKLNELTQNALEKIELEKDEKMKIIKIIYNNIYINGKKTFIEKE